MRECQSGTMLTQDGATDAAVESAGRTCGMFVQQRVSLFLHRRQGSVPNKAVLPCWPCWSGWLSCLSQLLCFFERDQAPRGVIPKSKVNTFKAFLEL